MEIYKEGIYPILARFDAEQIHDFTIKVLRFANYLPPRMRAAFFAPFNVDDQRLHVNVIGKEFKNRVGLGAGMDKNAEAVFGFESLGFGHIEIGTVTPRAQPGNEGKRITRIMNLNSLINSMGFPNEGAEVIEKNVAGAKRRQVILGLSIGPNKENAGEVNTAAEDLKMLIGVFRESVDYVAVNVSSPNTPELRSLGKREYFGPLITNVIGYRDSVRPDLPLLIKVSPDMLPDEFLNLLHVGEERGANGLIISNTTLARPGFIDSQTASIRGGYSGPWLGERSNELIRIAANETELPIFGVGGVENAADVIGKMRAGATLVQAYTGFVYGGPFFVAKINADLISEMNLRGFKSLSELVSSYN